MLSVTAEELGKLPMAERREKVRKAWLCFNCLKPGHMAARCHSKPCKRCGRKHHTVLHEDQESISTYSCVAQQGGVSLMTAVAEVKGETLRGEVPSIY